MSCFSDLVYLYVCRKVHLVHISTPNEFQLFKKSFKKTELLVQNLGKYQHPANTLSVSSSISLKSISWQNF